MEFKRENPGGLTLSCYNSKNDLSLSGNEEP
jgi:hypothetical protein